MATWIAHMRVAEYFMKREPHLNNVEFLVGSIGPDCGVPNENWSQFTPNKTITHWISDEPSQTIDAEGFRKLYLHINNEKHPFYLGYYLHLITDIEWHKLYLRKKLEPAYAEGLAEDTKFIWTIKKDWYGQDRLYLQKHKDSVFYTMFSEIEEFSNVYFDFYPDIAFIRQVKYITNYYSNADDEDPNREFPFLSKEEMDEFVIHTIKVIEDLI